jgi:hypothetical protein
LDTDLAMDQQRATRTVMAIFRIQILLFSNLTIEKYRQKTKDL